MSEVSRFAKFGINCLLASVIVSATLIVVHLNTSYAVNYEEKTERKKQVKKNEAPRKRPKNQALVALGPQDDSEQQVAHRGNTMISVDKH